MKLTVSHSWLDFSRQELMNKLLLVVTQLKQPPPKTQSYDSAARTHGGAAQAPAASSSLVVRRGQRSTQSFPCRSQPASPASDTELLSAYDAFRDRTQCGSLRLLQLKNGQNHLEAEAESYRNIFTRFRSKAAFMKTMLTKHLRTQEEPDSRCFRAGDACFSLIG